MKRAASFYLQEAKNFKGRIALLASVEVISATSMAIMPLLFALLVDKITEGNWQFVDYLPLLLMIVLAELADRLMVLAHFYVLEKTSIPAEKSIAKNIFAHLTKRSLGFHSGRLSGSLVADAKKVTRGFSDLLSFVIEGLLSNIVYFLVMIVALATQEIILVPIFTVACIILLAASWRIRRTETAPSLEETESDSLVSAHLADTLGNIETVIASGQRDQELLFYEDRVSDWSDDAKKLMRKRMKNIFLVFTMPLAILLPLLFGGVWLVTNNHLSAGALLLILLYGQRIIAIANSSNANITGAIEALSNASPMVEVLEEKIEIPDQSQKAIDIKSGTINIQRINFAYPNHSSLFENFSLCIPAGQRVGLVGASGAGKSTLLKMLLRMIEPRSGEILIDNQNIALYRADSLRQQISYVAQEPILFHRTIAENIAYGTQAKQTEIETAAHKAYADHFIEKLPEGYNSRAGDRGVKLSGGERQRIALARAFLRNNPVLLLDEPTSALDSYSEQLVQEATAELFYNRTVLVIAHRLSTLAHLDRIVVMQDGVVMEDGSHEELLQQNGSYARLWEKQSQGFLPEQ